VPIPINPYFIVRPARVIDLCKASRRSFLSKSCQPQLYLAVALFPFKAIPWILLWPTGSQILTPKGDHDNFIGRLLVPEGGTYDIRET
jgi:hypothetical protein